MQTRMQTHASTNVIVGTKPYMPIEYITYGHVSEKLDSFSFGVVLIELLTSLTGYQARELEMMAPTFGKSVAQDPGANALKWPSRVFGGLVATAERCTHVQPNQRSSMVAELPNLESLYAQLP
jgi:serine/threonine protein kinase